MFSAEDVQARLRAKPFRPLRIIVSEKQRYEVHHPDLVFVGRRDLMIGSPDPSNPTVYDRMVQVALVHVVALEQLPVSTTPGNGQD
jgi:hypothetical protein